MAAPTGVYPLVAGLARSLHATAQSRHHVASPLGAWLLLALCAPVAAGEARTQLERVLGTNPANAAALAGRLLSQPHPVVMAAAGAWWRPQSPQRRPAGLPESLTLADLAGQRQLDEWADQATQGLINRFPLMVGPTTSLVLATVLATKVTWRVPFQVTPAADLGAGTRWAGEIGSALRSPAGHDAYICTTPSAGDVAVHCAPATGGLLVMSVLAEPQVPPATVLAAAYDLAQAAATGAPISRRSLFELPLGDAPLWHIAEEPGPVPAPGGRQERHTAVLPAWSATTDLDLNHDELGFPLAGRALAAAGGLRDGQGQAAQSVVARYGRAGFEAAAVAALAVRMSFVQQVSGVVRHATLRFGHPFAVVAVAVDDASAAPAGPWHGLPVFSAWVTQVEDAESS